MAKRKLGASVIILLIAAITLISGTYAWFLVGGFASLFDIGFDVIEAQGGILLRGDDGTSGNGASTDWGNSLGREDFVANSFIAVGGSYKPVSSANGTSFLAVSMKDDEYKCDGVPANKTTAGSPSQICYNDFTFYVKSDGAELVNSAYMQINLNGNTTNEAGERVESNDNAAALAARVAVTVDNVTTIYSLDGASDSAVTTSFADGTVKEAGTKNQIIDAGDIGGSGFISPVATTALRDSEGVSYKISLGTVPDVSNALGKMVNVKIWLEGNDPQCIDTGDNKVAGKHLTAYVTFGVDE